MSNNTAAFVEQQAREMAERWMLSRRLKAGTEKGRGRAGRGVASGALSESLKSKSQFDQFGNGEVALAFEEYGRFLDMKKVSHDKWGRDMIDRLTKWVMRRGTEKFMLRFFEIYKYRPKVLDEATARRIAFGIAVGLTHGKFRRAAWYTKSRTAALYEAYNKIAAGLPDPVLKDIRENLPAANEK